jgi:nucleoside-diphosphate-sugar epimerase
MTGRRALISGGTGFVGTHLSARLLTEGWEVHVLIRPSSNVIRLRSAAPDVVVHEVEDHASSVVAAVATAAPEVCWHLATLFRSVHKTEDIDPLIEANVAFGARLAEGLARAGVPQLINIGTAWQHHRSAPYSPTSLYAATKQGYEDIVRYYTEAGDFRAVHLRLFDTYGPDDPRGKLVALLLERARTGEMLPMSPGEQLIDLLHVEDVVKGLIHAAELGVGPSSIHQLSSGLPLTLRQLAATIAEVTGSAVPIDWGARPYRAREMMEPWSAAPPLPGWSPTIPLEDGLRQLWEVLCDA